MRNKKTLMIAAFVGILAIIVLMLFTGGSDETEVALVEETPSSAANMGEVIVVRQDMPARTVITPEMIEVQNKPAEYIHPMAVTKIEDALEMITLVPINAGEEIIQTKIADPNTNYLSYKLKEGHVAFTVPVSDLSAAAGMIRVGDQVHVLGNFAEDVAGKNLSQFVLYDLKVLAIGQDMAMNGMSPDAESFANMTLEVTTEQATELSWASNHGTLTYILKSVLDKEDTEEFEAAYAASFFGDVPQYEDKEYTDMLKKVIELRENEQKLNEYGKGDVDTVRNELEYSRFYYDYLNKKDSTSGDASKGGTGKEPNSSNSK